jgi:hypothetical protein
MRTPSEDLIRARKLLTVLKPRQSLKRPCDLRMRRVFYNAAKDIGIVIRALVTPETKGAALNERLFEVERIA